MEEYREPHTGGKGLEEGWGRVADGWSPAQGIDAGSFVGQWPAEAGAADGY